MACWLTQDNGYVANDMSKVKLRVQAEGRISEPSSIM